MELLVPKQDFNTYYNNVLIKYQIPFEIKNDIIYCQKALRTYLKVHQMVLLHFRQFMTALPAVRKLLDDLEREIYEINAEQRYLIYRLRKSLEEFYKSIPLNNIIIDQDADNTFLRHSFSKHVDDPNYPCEAISVKTRRTFSQWKKKFYLDDPKRMLNDSRNFNINNIQSSKTPILPNGCITPNPINLQQQQKQRVSLLKPKCERDLARLIYLDQNMEIKHEDENSCYGNDEEKIVPATINSENNTMDVMVEVEEKPILEKIDSSKNQEEPSIKLKPSPAMNIGRMKLLQALNNAKNLKESPLAQPQVAAASVKSIPEVKSVQKSPEQQKLLPKFVEVSSSSSDDSLDGIHVLPSIEPERPNVFQINQEMFLRQFGLYTLQHSAYLKQRRSKRRRRNVQINGRKDFHYGTINFAAIDAQTASFPKEKKKKIFLASPTISRKSNKRRKSAKDDNSNNKTNNKSDRSSTSSPDEKFFCNVCFRSNKLLTLNCCKKCKQFYHISCHSKYGIKLGYSSTKKICPVCIRAKKSSRSASSEGYAQRFGEALIPLPSVGGENKVRRSSLIDQCNFLKQKIVTAKSRHSSLLKESEIYKTKMNQLFNIVGTIKNQQDELKEKETTNVMEIEISDDEIVDNKNKNYESNGAGTTIEEKSKPFILASSSSSLSSRDSKEEIKLIEYDRNNELFDSDEDILVIKEDNSIIEIQDGINEEESSEN